MARRGLTVLLLAFVAFSVVWAYARPGGPTTEVVGTAHATTAKRVVVWYLHGTRRCATCEGIEAGARRVVEGSYADALRDGDVELVIGGIESPDLAPHAQRFGLVSTSLVVESRADSRFEILEKVWQHVGDDAAFDAYVSAAVARALGEQP
jgi:hypothetical protein